MATLNDLDNLLVELHRQGMRTLTAGYVAEKLWPASRTHNANGQAFPLGAGVAGRMLRRSKLVWECEPRVWEIIPERIEYRD